MMSTGLHKWIAVLACALPTAGRWASADAAPSLTRIPRLPPPQFFDAVREILVADATSLDEVWPILERCRLELDEARASEVVEEDGVEGAARFEHQSACGGLASQLAARASGLDRERILATLDGLPAGDWLRAPLLRGLVEHRLAKVLADPPQPAAEESTSGSPPEIPERLSGATRDLQEAWRLHRSLVRGYWSRLEAARRTGRISFQEKEDDFDRAVADFVRGRVSADVTIERIERFTWGGGCGMGSERLAEPQARVLLLAHLEAGHRALAAGAALDAIGSPGSMQNERSTLPEGWDRRLLASLGYDWEALFIGGLMDGWPNAATLARHGSDEAARLMLAARDVTSSDEGDERLSDQEEYWRALAAFVTPSGGCRRPATDESSEDVERAADAGAVGADVEAEVLDLLEGRIGPEAGLNEASTAAHLLVRACRDESRVAFRTMASRSPYAKVRAEGAFALASLGEKPPPVPTVRPVAYRIMVDGAPARGLKVTQTLLVDSETRVESDPTEESTTDALGVARFDSDPYFDVKNVVKGIVLGVDCQSADAPCFSVELPRPHALDDVTPISVDTQVLAFSCPAAVGPRSMAFVTQEEPTEGDGSGRIGGPLLLHDLGPVTVRRLQRGLYRVAVLGRQGQWLSDVVSLGAKPLTIECGPLVAFERSVPHPGAEPLIADVPPADEGEEREP